MRRKVRDFKKRLLFRLKERNDPLLGSWMKRRPSTINLPNLSQRQLSMSESFYILDEPKVIMERGEEIVKMLRIMNI
eukprot:gene17155-22669_t